MNFFFFFEPVTIINQMRGIVASEENDLSAHAAAENRSCRQQVVRVEGIMVRDTQDEQEEEI